MRDLASFIYLFINLFIYSQERIVNQRPFSVIRRAGCLWGTLKAVSHTARGWPAAHVEAEEGHLHLKEKKQSLARSVHFPRLLVSVISFFFSLTNGGDVLIRRVRSGIEVRCPVTLEGSCVPRWVDSLETAPKRGSGAVVLLREWWWASWETLVGHERSQLEGRRGRGGLCPQVMPSIPVHPI